MTPLGYLSSRAISAGEAGDISQYFDKIMAIVIGIFLHISTTILFESGSADHHTFHKRKMIAVLLGVLVSLSSLLFPHEHQHDHQHDIEHHHEALHDHS